MIIEKLFYNPESARLGILMRNYGPNSILLTEGGFSLERFKDAKCCECGGKPDYVYFMDNGEKLFGKYDFIAICQDCRNSFDATIRSIGRGYAEWAKKMPN